MIACQRHLFHIPDDVTYLNCAYTSPLPKPVEQAGALAMELKRSPWKMGTDLFFSGLEAAREAFAKVVGAKADNVAVVGATSYAMALAAKNLPVPAGSRVVVLADQFPSNVYPWSGLPGVSLSPVARPAEGAWSKAVEAAITPGVSLVALPHCHWTDGTVFDLAAIRLACDAVGAHLVVDATQSAGMLPLDLAAVRPDFMAVSAHKWLLCPYGVSFALVDDKWLDGKPLEENWMNRAGSEDFSRLTEYRDQYRHGARRYDMGQASSFFHMPMAAAALELMAGWGARAIAQTLAPITNRLATAGAAFGLGPTPLAERAPHMVGLALQHGSAKPLAEALAKVGVFVSARGQSLRLAPHVYTNSADVERFIGMLARCLST